MFCTQRLGRSCPQNASVCRNLIRSVVSAFSWLTFLGISKLAWCADVGLQWDPVLDDPLVTGYEVYYGPASGQYDSVVQANVDGAATSTKTVENLVAGNTYFFAVRSRNHDPALVSAFSNEVSVTIGSATNQPPEVTNPGAQSSAVGEVVSLRIAAEDPDGDSLTYMVAGLPPGLSIDSQSGLIDGTLVARSEGDYMVTVTVSDGSKQANTIFSWLVSATNHAPVVTNPGAQSSTEGDRVSLEILANDKDGDNLSYVASGMPASLGIDAVTGIISGMLETGSAGAYGVTVTVSDSSEQADAIFSWVVSAANHLPVVDNPGTQTGTEGDEVSLRILATDPDGDRLTYAASGLPEDLSIDALTGIISGTLATGSDEVYSVTVTVSDGSEQVNAIFDWIIDAPTIIRAEAGVVELEDVTSEDWMLVALDHTYDSMVVVATPRYSLPAPPQIVRVRNASGNSFEVGIARVDGGTGVVSTTVDYLVVEEGVYDAETHGVTMEAVKYTSAVTDYSGSWQGEWQIYANDYNDPVVIGQVMSANDPLPSSFWARGKKPSDPPDAFSLYTGKSVSEDRVRNRYGELVGYIVVEAGTGILGGRHFEARVGTDSVRGIGNNSGLFYQYPLGNLVSAEVTLLSTAGIDGLNGGWPILDENFDHTGSEINLAVDEDQLKDPERNHVTEQIAYMVLEYPTVGSVSP